MSLPLFPAHLLTVQRHAADRHLGRGVLHLAAVGDVKERLVLLVIDAADAEAFEDQAHPLAEHLLALRPLLDLADRDRPGLAAGDRGVGRVLEPVALSQPVEDAAAEVGEVAGHTLHLRVLDRLHDDAVARPVVREAAHLVRAGGRGEEGEGGSEKGDRPHGRVRCRGWIRGAMRLLTHRRNISRDASLHNGPNVVFITEQAVPVE